MNEMPYVHVGVIVPELEAAIRSFERLGLTFMEPRIVHVDRMVEGDEEGEVDLRIVFSHQGPPHLELIEATGHGVYGPQHVGGLHHIAVLDADPARRTDELVRVGLSLVGAQYRTDGSMIVSYFEGLPGISLELLDVNVQETILAWVRGEDATP